MIYYHKTCSTLSIYAFYKLVETQDLKWLIKDYDDEEVKITPFETNLLVKASDEIMNEYGGLTVNNKVISTYKRQILISYLEYKYQICEDIVSLYEQCEREEVLDLLDAFNVKTRNLDEIKKKINSWKMQSNIQKANNKQKNTEISKDIVRNLDKEAMMLELNLKLGYNLDVKKISVTRWVNMLKLSEEKVKNYG